MAQATHPEWDAAIYGVHMRHARELWDVLSKGTKTCINCGVVPAAVLAQEVHLGYDPTLLSIALLEMARGTR
jgi:hypothetical protein